MIRNQNIRQAKYGIVKTPKKKKKKKNNTKPHTGGILSGSSAKNSGTGTKPERAKGTGPDEMSLVGGGRGRRNLHLIGPKGLKTDLNKSPNSLARFKKGKRQKFESRKERGRYLGAV